MRFVIIGFLLTVSACSSKPAAEPSQEALSGRVVVYVANVSDTREFCRLPDGCQLRMIDPRTERDELIQPLAGIPLNLWWDEKFSEVHYRIGNRVYRAAWIIGAKPEAVLDVPDALAKSPDTIVDLWRDSITNRWRIKTLEYAGEGADERATAGIWEYSEPRGWTVLARRPTECGCGDCPCAEVMNQWVQPKPRRALRAMLEDMRIAQHLERAQPGEEWPEGRRGFISMNFPDTSYEFDLVFGDSYHAMAPFVLQRGGSAEPQTIYDKGAECGDQLAFREEEGFLLVAAEFTGACARLVNLHSGRIVANLPNTVANAVWTNRTAEPRQ